MCLIKYDTYSSEAIKKKFEGKTFGWKVFRKTQEGLTGQYYGQHKCRPIGKWLESKKFCKLKTTFLADYPAGWHIFLSRKDARIKRKDAAKYYAYSKFVVKKVRFRKPIIYGYQDFGKVPCVVAKEILIERGKV